MTWALYLGSVLVGIAAASKYTLYYITWPTLYYITWPTLYYITWPTLFYIMWLTLFYITWHTFFSTSRDQSAVDSECMHEQSKMVVAKLKGSWFNCIYMYINTQFEIY